jgi:hypothetical protein
MLFYNPQKEEPYQILHILQRSTTTRNFMTLHQVALLLTHLTSLHGKHVGINDGRKLKSIKVRTESNDMTCMKMCQIVQKLLRGADGETITITLPATYLYGQTQLVIT